MRSHSSYYKGYLVHIYHLAPSSSTYPCAPRLSISLILDLRASPILSLAKLIMHRHVCIGFFHFPFVHLTHITSLFLIAFRLVPCSKLSCIITSATHSHGYAFVTGVAVSTSCHDLSSLSNRHPLFTLHCPQRTTGPSKFPSTSCTTAVAGGDEKTAFKLELRGGPEKLQGTSRTVVYGTRLA